MNLFKLFQILIIAITFWFFSSSLLAEKTKKNKSKQTTQKTKEAKKNNSTERKEKEDIPISVKTSKPEKLIEKEEEEDEIEEPLFKNKETKTTPAPSAPTPTVATSPEAVHRMPAGDTVNPITLNQYFSNDIWFRGFSVLGDRLAQRDNRQFQSMQHAWNLVTGVSYNVTENISIGMNFYNPTAHRANRDNDYYMQSAPGNKNDYTNDLLIAGQTGNPAILRDSAVGDGADPSSIKRRKEKNGLKDIFDASFIHKYNTRFGKIVTGFYFANNDNFNITLGELVAGIEFPFLKVINPSFTSFYRVTSEGGGGGNGTSNHRLAISHTFFPENKINLALSLSAGYQYHNNLADYRSGVSDITPKIQVNFGSFYVSFMNMNRPDSSLWDTPSGFGTAAVYADTNRRDGRVNDPSKVHGSTNQAVVNGIAAAAESNRANDSTGGYATDLAKLVLTQQYQQQKFVSNIYFFTIGYSMKF